MATATVPRTLFLLDFDDTLFPTSWVTRFKPEVAGPVKTQEIQDQFKRYAAQLGTFLTNVHDLSDNVVVVTHSTPDWIEHITDRLFTKPEFDDVRKGVQALRVVAVEDNKPKLATFASLIDEHATCEAVFGMSDMAWDRTDFLAACKEREVFCKHIAFVQAPSVEELRHQLAQMNGVVRDFVARREHVDLRTVVTLHLPPIV